MPGNLAGPKGDAFVRFENLLRRHFGNPVYKTGRPDVASSGIVSTINITAVPSTSIRCGRRSARPPMTPSKVGAKVTGILRS
jgi:hypothetical protein